MQKERPDSILPIKELLCERIPAEVSPKEFSSRIFTGLIGADKRCSPEGRFIKLWVALYNPAEARSKRPVVLSVGNHLLDRSPFLEEAATPFIAQRSLSTRRRESICSRP